MKNKMILMLGILLLASIGFVLAYSAPVYNNIPQELCASYTAPAYNNIDSRLSPCTTDTCTVPSVNNNWNVLWRDNCTVSSNTDLGTGALNLYGAVTGSFTLNADLYCSNLWSTQPTTGFGRIINFQRLKIR